MANVLPVVCIFGVKNINLISTPECPKFETKELDCRCYLTDDNLQEILAKDKPRTIITIGEPQDFPNLYACSPDVAKRWINFKDTTELARMGAAAFHCFVDHCVRKRTALRPLVSVFTPAYKTGDRIKRPYDSLLKQHYNNWEWVIFDDSDDDGSTFSMLKEMAETDHRISVFRHHEHSGVIGQVKNWACHLCRGDFLVELDHDDELTPNALGDIVKGFEQFSGQDEEHPYAGFVYTDFAEVFADGSPLTYSENWGHGYGSYRWEWYGERRLAIANAANINPKTMRHIVAAPNHARCWRSEFYKEIGGHSRTIHVADDYELMVRTFLKTRMVRVPSLCHIQWRNPEGDIKGGNTHRERNHEIQRLVRAFSQWYDKDIHARFVELGVDDFVYKEGQHTFWNLQRIENPPEEPHCTLTAKL